MPAKKLKLPKRSTAIKFVNAEGHVLNINGKMTLKELLKMGVTHINIVKPDAPFEKNEYRSTP